MSAATYLLLTRRSRYSNDGGEGANNAGKWNNIPVSAYDINGDFIKSFVSQKECAKFFNTSRENVMAVSSGRNTLLLKKYQIRKGNNISNIGNPKERKKHIRVNNPTHYYNSKKIICTKDDKIFDSQMEASKFYNISVKSINNILNGRADKTRSGASFRYL